MAPSEAPPSSTTTTTTTTSTMMTTSSSSSTNPHHAGGAEALRLQAGTDGKLYNDDSGIVRRRTEVERQVLSHEAQADEILHRLPAKQQEEEATTAATTKAVPQVDLFLPDVLQGAIFVGHVVTDLDSVAGAMGAAALYGGTAALASTINSETTFAFQEWGVPVPQYIEDLLQDNPRADVCLVDHQQTSQLNPCIPVENIVGVIDHHALQSKTIVTDKPIYIDIRVRSQVIYPSWIVCFCSCSNACLPRWALTGWMFCRFFFFPLRYFTYTHNSLGVACRRLLHTPF